MDALLSTGNGIRSCEARHGRCRPRQRQAREGLLQHPPPLGGIWRQLAGGQLPQAPEVALRRSEAVLVCPHQRTAHAPRQIDQHLDALLRAVPAADKGLPKLASSGDDAIGNADEPAPILHRDRRAGLEQVTAQIVAGLKEPVQLAAGLGERALQRAGACFGSSGLSQRAASLRPSACFGGVE